MAIYVAPDDAIGWLITQYFAGKTAGHAVTWINQDGSSDFPGHYLGSHRIDLNEGICQVHVSEQDNSGNMLDPEQMWSILIFEFHNLSNHKQWRKIGNLAFSGKLTRSEYIRMYTYAEYQAIVKTKAFYEVTWIPHLKQKKLPTNPQYWLRGYKAQYEQWIQQYTKEDYYPYDSFGAEYDEVVIPYLKQRKIPLPRESY